MPISQGRSQNEIETEKAVNENQLNGDSAKQILIDARIIARWAKKPFYIS